MIYKVEQDVRARIVELAQAVPLSGLKQVVDDLSALLDHMLEVTEAEAADPDSALLDTMLEDLDKANDSYQAVWKVLQERRGRGEQ